MWNLDFSRFHLHTTAWATLQTIWSIGISTSSGIPWNSREFLRVYRSNSSNFTCRSSMSLFCCFEAFLTRPSSSYKEATYLFWLTKSFFNFSTSSLFFAMTFRSSATSLDSLLLSLANLAKLPCIAVMALWIFLRRVNAAIYNNYSMSPSWIWSDKMTNECVARVGYNHFISNRGEWNNCFSKFANQILPLIFISTILQSGKCLNLAHYFPYDVKLRILAHSRSFLANQKARKAIVGAENLLNKHVQL